MIIIKPLILMWGLLGISKGLSIDVDEIETTDCLLPSVVIKCITKTEELRTGNNKLMITHGGLTKASCDWSTGTCTIAENYNATIEGTNAVLKIKNMDIFYDSNAWACNVGAITASMKLKYFRAEPEPLVAQFISLRHISIVDLLTLLLVITILLFLIVRFCFQDCCKRKRPGGKDAESGSCTDCFCFCRKKEEPKPTGYQGKKYTVRENYNIEDPNHVPDARFKGGPDRRTEAEKVCKNVSDEQKDIIKENLTQYTEARKPLISTTSETDSKM